MFKPEQIQTAQEIVQAEEAKLAGAVIDAYAASLAADEITGKGAVLAVESFDHAVLDEALAEFNQDGQRIAKACLAGARRVARAGLTAVVRAKTTPEKDAGPAKGLTARDRERLAVAMIQAAGRKPATVGADAE